MKKHLTLLHTNDIHGDFIASEKDGVLTGGIDYLSGYINKTRQHNKNTLFAIAGDMFRGSVIDSEYKGISTVELVDYLNPDVVTLGNHEVDYGLAHLLFLEKCARFPIINANLFIKTNNARLFKPYLIKKINGLKVMFIGILTEEVLAVTKSEDIIGSFVDVKEAAREVGIICDNYRTTDVDLTVLLTHIGFEEDKKLAQLLNPEWGVDIIIGGHSHTLLEEPCIVNNIPIVQCGTGTGHLGRFDFEFDGSEKTYKWSLVDINEKTAERNEVLSEILDSYKKRTDVKYQRILTVFNKKLTHPNRYQETEIGNLFADLLQADSSFDVMLLASGSIRKPELGPVVTYQNLTEIAPFDNLPVHMLEVTGKQFRDMLKYMLRDEMFEGAHTEFYQLSKGMHVKYSRSRHDFVEFTLNGKEIKDEDRIRIALQEYHYLNFNEFFNVRIEDVVKNKKPRVVMTSAFSIYEELLTGSMGLDAEVEGRIEVVE